MQVRKSDILPIGISSYCTVGTRTYEDRNPLNHPFFNFLCVKIVILINKIHRATSTSEYSIHHRIDVMKYRNGRQK